MSFSSTIDNNTGFWDTIGGTPSTIDWCETNYTVHPYIAEFQNSLSSLFIAFGGLCGLYWAVRYGHPQQLIILSILVTIVGLGSTAFHGTLLFIPQLFDELPMVFAMSSFGYLYLTVAKSALAVKRQWFRSEKSKGPKSPSSSLLQDIDESHLFDDEYAHLLHFTPLKPFYFLSHLFKGTVVQQILEYNIPLSIITAMTLLSAIHAFYGFVILFQISFGVITLGGVFFVCECPTLFTQGDSPDLKKIFDQYKSWTKFYFLTAILAFVCWLIDNTFCDTLLSSPLGVYISGHALWHTLNYFSTYSGIVLAGYGLQMASLSCQVDISNLQTTLELQRTIPKSSTQQAQLVQPTQLKLTPGDVREIDLLPCPGFYIFTGVDHLADLHELV